MNPPAERHAPPDLPAQATAGARERAGCDAAGVVAVLLARGETVATAESLTGGLVVAALTGVPGASGAVRGGICVYHADVKHDLAGVDADALRSGAVTAQVAAQLAAGARERFSASWGIGTTGVAGPGPADGCPVGTVFVAVAGPGAGTGPGSAPVRCTGLSLSLTGDREAIRCATVRTVLDLLASRLGE